MMRPGLRIECLTAGYGGRAIVRDVTIAVRPGEVVAVLGLNGSGKSTVLRAVMGLANVVAGAIRVGDEDVLRLPVHQRARRWFGYLAQGGRVFPRLTVEEHVRRGLRGVSKSVAGSRIAEVLDRVPALEPLLTRRTSVLSSGMRQLVALSTTLVAPHAHLLLDEPTASLASDNVEAAVAWIRSKAREGGSGVLLVEQNLSVAQQLADRVVLIAGGSIAGSHEAPLRLDVGVFEPLLEASQASTNGSPEASASDCRDTSSMEEK